MRRALLAAAVTSTMVAVRRLRNPGPPSRVYPPAVPVVPLQRTATPSFLDDDADLSVAEQQAQDDRVLEALDRF